MELSGDEFDERLYDRDCGAGAAQRAVDSIRAEREDGGDAAGNTDGEKKEPSMEEQVEMTKEAVHKILDILKELPPPCFAAACMTLKMALPGPMGGMAVALMMAGPLTPPQFGKFDVRTDRQKQRDHHDHRALRTARIKENALHKPPYSLRGADAPGGDNQVRYILYHTPGAHTRGELCAQALFGLVWNSTLYNYIYRGDVFLVLNEKYL